MLIDVAESKVSAAVYRRTLRHSISDLLDGAEALLLEAGRSATEPADLLRAAEGLGRHARVAMTGRHSELAVFLLLRAIQAGAKLQIAQEITLDVLWFFAVGSGESRIILQHRSAAESMLTDHPGYAHYYLALNYGLVDDRRGMQHMGFSLQPISAGTRWPTKILTSVSTFSKTSAHRTSTPSPQRGAKTRKGQ
ncbi:MAG: hypothetical protein IPI35_20115 [Deltaproteobacteria bacterium]|nr:hypothetical protein [Deltaproteobacteria bacterium]